MPKLLVHRGISASGKTTAARELVQHGWTRANRDDIRDTLHGGKWSRANEKIVVKVRDAIIIAGLEAGQNVVSDDTNLSDKVVEHLRQLAKRCGAQFEIRDFPIDLHTAIERDAKRVKSVGETVIRQQWNQFIRPGLRVENDPSLPPIVLVDVDGTLAHMDGKRSPFDYAAAGEDRLDPQVATQVARETATVAIVSGRDEACRDVTELWLKTNGVKFDMLLMRPEGDTRRDSVVKREIWEQNFKGKFYVDHVWDDRAQVVDLYRDLGFKVFAVDDGRF